MECVAFSFLNNVGRRIIAIFQDDNVKIHQAQTVKEWFYTWIGTFKSRP